MRELPQSFQNRAAPRAMTLIEMLVATTMALIVMGVVAQLFSAFGNGVTNSQSLMDLNARMRTTAWRLRQDLKGATAPTTPPLNPDAGLGYFEIIEGPRRDLDAADGTTDLAADTDDVLLFTTKTTATPFTGRFDGVTVSSDSAEVAWFLRPTVPQTTPPTFTLYRKQLLVVGYVGINPFQAGGNQIDYSPFIANGLRDVYDRYDLSLARLRASASNDVLVPNTLADLTRRERRFLHNITGDVTGTADFPYRFISNHQIASDSGTAESLPSSHSGLIFDSTSARFGEDVVMNNILAFDVRVFDPAAPIESSGNTAIVPGDQTSVTSANANGAYVDLGNDVNISASSLPTGIAPRFSGFGEVKSQLTGTTTTARTYDTWSTHYETNGVDEDGVAGADQGTNGADDIAPSRYSGQVPAQPQEGVIDDLGEQETSPPYPYPLRGIEVRIRCYEPSSRQVRQVTVRHTFVPH
jgi:type II secretory pathway pseudopilin PulG